MPHMCARTLAGGRLVTAPSSGFVSCVLLLTHGCKPHAFADHSFHGPVNACMLHLLPKTSEHLLLLLQHCIGEQLIWVRPGLPLLFLYSASSSHASFQSRQASSKRSFEGLFRKPTHETSAIAVCRWQQCETKKKKLQQPCGLASEAGCNAGHPRWRCLTLLRCP